MITSSDLTKKITFIKKSGNSLLNDNPIYTTLFSTYAKMTVSSTGGFDSNRGTDMLSTNADVIVRDTANMKKLILNNTYLQYKGVYYRITSQPMETEDKGFLRFTINSQL